MPPFVCAHWCSVDHEAGDFACQTDKRYVVRIPTDPKSLSSVHGFRVMDGCVPRLTIGGQFYSIEAAREYAQKILAVADQVDAPA